MPRLPRNRRRVVDAMSDHIEEEDDATQFRRRDVDAVDAEEDEEVGQQPRPPRRTLSRSGRAAAAAETSASGSGMAAGRSAMETEHEHEHERDGDADVDEDEDADAKDATPVFDADSVGNKPLSRHDGQRLQGMASDWNMIETNLKENAFSLLTEVSTAVAEYADESTAKKELERLDSLMRQIIDIDVEIRSHEQTLKDLHQRVVAGDEISNVLELYQTQTQEKLGEYNQRTSRQKYAKSEAYASFRQSIYEVQNPNEAMPPVVEFLPQEEGDNSDDDEDDIQVGGVLQDFNCPITLTPLVDPQTSTVCQHSFSAAAIRQMLGPNRFTKKKCPASGCNQMICLNDLKPNKELERRVKAYQRRAKRREEEQDAEEVVE
ncbi:hypothetical protein BC827DRAFT_1162230 [Russula dissimulans]|nr:hypothetical protein BC827DRAFT_1162230 [Russula dissimulans]